MGRPNLKIYSAAEVSVVFALVPLESGRGEDQFVSIEKKEDSYTYKSGVDGEGTRSEILNSLYEVKLTLMGTSNGNEVLSAIHNGDLVSSAGAGIAPILIRDRQGLSIFASPQSWIVKAAPKNYKKEVDTVEWTIHVHAAANFIAGN